MDPKCSLFLSFLLLLSSATSAFNITKLLGQHPEFKTFNDYLTQTQLAAEINRRETITVLAVDDGALSSVSGKPMDVIKNVLSLHVVLDYYDVKKLQTLSKKTSLLTTLFQASGSANGQGGFLNVTDLSTGQVVFGSGEKGSTLGAKLVKSIAAQPYNISVLQISSVIVPTGIENTNSSSNSTTSTPPSAAPKKSTTQAPTPSKPSSTASPAKAPSAHSAAPSGDAPSEADAPTVPDAPVGAADAPSVADAPASDANAPTGADGPAAADAPSLSSPPSPSIADGPAADGPSGEASAPVTEGKSSGTHVAFGTSLVIMTGIVSSLVAF